MRQLADLFAHGGEQPVITEPAICDNQNRLAGKGVGNVTEHIHGLLKFSFKGKRFPLDFDQTGFDDFFMW